MEKASGILHLEINNEYFMLERGQSYLLGKQIHPNRIDVDCANCIWLKHEQLDMKHCLIEVAKNGDVFLIDLCSVVGTYVNGKRLQTLKKVPLSLDDDVKLGDQVCRLCQNKTDECDSSGFLESNKSLSKNNSHSLDEAQLMVTNININVSSGDNSNIVIPETQFIKESETLNTNYNNNKDLRLNKDFEMLLNDEIGMGEIILDNTNQDCCIPETQEISPQKYDVNINLQADKNDDAKKSQQYVHDASIREFSNADCRTTSSTATAAVVTTAGAAAAVSAATINDGVDVGGNGSQFRICTQDFYEVTETDDINPEIQSQILNIIFNKKENNVKQATSSNSQEEKSIEQQQKQSQKEQSNKENSSETSEKPNHHRNDMVTPDFSDLENLTPELNCDNLLDVCVEDFLETQKYPGLSKKLQVNTPPNISANIFVSEGITTNKNSNEKSEIFNEKSEQLHMERERKHSDCIEDFLETQKYPGLKQKVQVNTPPNISANIFVSEGITTNKNSNEKSEIFNEKSEQKQIKDGQTHSKEDGIVNENLLNKQLTNISSFNQNNNDEDVDEDDLLTQALLKPTTTPNISRSDSNNKLIKSTTIIITKAITTTAAAISMSTSTPSAVSKITKCHNSTMLDGASHTNLEKCFDDSAATPTTLKLFNVNKGEENLNKTITMLTPIGLGRTTSLSTTDSDVDFLKSTPQIINMHINIAETKQLNVKINAPSENTSKPEAPNDSIKSVNKDDDNENCVTFLNPKDTKDFDILLKNLNVPQATPNAQSTKSETLKAKHNNDLEVTKSKVKDGVNRLVATVNQEFTEHENPKNTLEKGNVKWQKRNELDTKNHKKLIVKLPKINLNNFDFGRFRSSSTVMSNQKPKPKHNPKPTQQQNPKKDSKASSNALSNTHPRVRSSREISTNESNTQDNIPTQPLDRRASIQNSKRNTSSKEIRNSTNDMKTMRKRKISTHAANMDTHAKRSKQNELSEDDISTQPLPSTSYGKSKKKLQISTSMIDPNILEDLLKHSKGFWSVPSDPTNSEILVMDKGCRTYKFLLAMAKGIPIVTTQWLRKVNKNHCLMPFEDDFLNDSEFEKRYKFSILQSLRQVNRRRKPLFYGYEFAVTSNIIPIPQEIKVIIECSGGQVHTDIKMRTNIPTLYLISCAEDKKDWHMHRRLCKNLIIITTEAIMSAVMQQSVDGLQRNLLH